MNNSEAKPVFLKNVQAARSSPPDCSKRFFIVGNSTASNWNYKDRRHIKKGTQLVQLPTVMA
jgi:hypothetical protein